MVAGLCPHCRSDVNDILAIDRSQYREDPEAEQAAMIAKLRKAHGQSADTESESPKDYSDL